MKPKERIIRVTHKDIELGQKRLGFPTQTCAIARALKRVYGEKWVKDSGWEWSSGNIGHEFFIFAKNPQMITAFVRAHDNDKKVKPFSFVVVEKRYETSK